MKNSECTRDDFCGSQVWKPDRPSLSFPAACVCVCVCVCERERVCVCKGGNAFLFITPFCPLSLLTHQLIWQPAPSVSVFHHEAPASGEGTNKFRNSLRWKTAATVFLVRRRKCCVCVSPFLCLCVSVCVCVFGSVIWVASQLLAHSYWASFIGSVPQTKRFPKHSPAGRQHTVTLFFCCCFVTDQTKIQICIQSQWKRWMGQAGHNHPK